MDSNIFLHQNLISYINYKNNSYNIIHKRKLTQGHNINL
jgi:hypothetical protein